MPFQVWWAYHGAVMNKPWKESFLAGDSQADCLGETPCFCYFITREAEGWGGGPWRLAQITLWRMLGAAEQTALKEPFFSTSEKVVHQLRPRSCSQKKKKSPRPFAADPLLLPACFSWLQTKRFMWLDWGWPPPLTSEDTCFPVGWGRVGVGRVEQGVEGVSVGRSIFIFSFSPLGVD